MTQIGRGVLVSALGFFLACGGAGCSDDGAVAESGGSTAGRRSAPSPKCITALTAPCPLEGACTKEASADGKSLRLCFGSGVRLVYDFDKAAAQCTPGDSTVTTVYAAGGAVCYKETQLVGAGCESSSGTVYDAAGNKVALKNSPFNGSPSLTCTDGSSWNCGNPTGKTCEVDPFDYNACTEGSCPLDRQAEARLAGGEAATHQFSQNR